MCLTAKRGKYYRAKRDIPCYKVVYVEDNGNWSGAFGYSDKEFEFDKVLKETNGRPKPKKEEPNFVVLNNGYFHVYSRRHELFAYTINMAIVFRMEKGYSTKRKNFIMCRCTIPKGTVFYKDCINGGFASRKLIVHKPKELKTCV